MVGCWIQSPSRNKYYLPLCDTRPGIPRRDSLLSRHKISTKIFSLYIHNYMLICLPICSHTRPERPRPTHLLRRSLQTPRNSKTSTPHCRRKVTKPRCGKSVAKRENHLWQFSTPNRYSVRQIFAALALWSSSPAPPSPRFAVCQGPD